MGESSKEVIIYTDGGAEPNPGPGGYGAVLIYGNHRREIFGGFRMTTNNRMEIFAAIKALDALKHPCVITLYSDSKYVVEAMSRGWAINWQRKGWRRNRKHPVMNADLWKTLLSFCTVHTVHFEWVKGHAGNVENERCDALSMQFLKMKDLQIDEEYESTTVAGSSEPSLLLATPEDSPSSVAATATTGRPSKITAENQPCRKCQTPVIKQIPRRREPRPGQDYYYEYYLFCPGCKTMYMIDDAKRSYPSSSLDSPNP